MRNYRWWWNKIVKHEDGNKWVEDEEIICRIQGKYNLEFQGEEWFSEKPRTQNIKFRNSRTKNQNQNLKSRIEIKSEAKNQSQRPQTRIKKLKPRNQNPPPSTHTQNQLKSRNQKRIQNQTQIYKNQKYNKKPTYIQG